MKMHSYMAVNGYMADNYFRMKRIEDMIEERVADIEGSRPDEHPIGRSGVTEEAWRRAIENAAAVQVRERKRVEEPGEAIGSSSAVDESSAATGTDSKAAGDSQNLLQPQVWDSLPAQRGTNILRQRALPSVIDRRPSTSRTERPNVHKAGDGSKNEQVIRDPHPLATHPDKVISDLAREVEMIREELTSSTPAADEVNPEVYTETMTWPANVTFANFWDYLLVPTLVYELSYPRLRTVRPLYLLEKALATFGTFFVIYVITEHWIMPRQPDPSTPLVKTFLELAVPMMLNVRTACCFGSVIREDRLANW